MAVAERSTPTPLYREVVHDRTFGAGMIFCSLLIIIGIPVAAIYGHQGHTHEVFPIVQLSICVAALLPMPVYAYFGVYPLQVAVDKQGLILRSGKMFTRRNETISFSSITAIRRKRYCPRDYEKSDRPVESVAGAQVWKMGGKEVLEIDVQDSRRIILLSARADQLASLLHEMTRVSVEDCR